MAEDHQLLQVPRLGACALGVGGRRQGLGPRHRPFAVLVEREDDHQQQERRQQIEMVLTFDVLDTVEDEPQGLPEENDRGRDERHGQGRIAASDETHGSDVIKTNAVRRCARLHAAALGS